MCYGVLWCAMVHACTSELAGCSDEARMSASMPPAVAISSAISSLTWVRVGVGVGVRVRVRVGVRVRVRFRVRARVGIRVRFRVGDRVRVRVGVRVG
jgi:hypothetical protein